MEEILHHLGCTKPVNNGDSGVNCLSTDAGVLRSAVFYHTTWRIIPVSKWLVTPIDKP